MYPTFFPLRQQSQRKRTEMNTSVNFLEDPAQTLTAQNMRYDLFGQPVTDAAGFTAGIIPTRPTDNNVTDGMYVPPYVSCTSFSNSDMQTANVPVVNYEWNGNSQGWWGDQNFSAPSGGQAKNSGGQFFDSTFNKTMDQTKNAVTTGTPSSTLPPVKDNSVVPGAAPLPGFSQVTNAPVPQTVKVVDSSKAL